MPTSEFTPVALTCPEVPPASWRARCSVGRQSPGRGGGALFFLSAHFEVLILNGPHAALSQLAYLYNCAF
jgi:hypothetical protein